MSGPLERVKIVEMAGVGPSPYACMLLADMGADILRIERGDPLADPVPTGDILARSRPSVAVDLKNDAGRELILKLCEQADALIEGYRPGVMERLGLGPETVERRNPRIVYGRMTGFGQEGPLSERAGHDINFIAVSGALWPIGRAGERPVPPLNLVGDFGGGGLFLALGVVSAILFAQESGIGQVVDCSMVDGSASLLSMTHSLLNQGRWVEERGVNLLDSGAPFYEVYETADQKFVAVGAIEHKFYSHFIEGLGLKIGDLPDQMDESQWPTVKEKFKSIFYTKSRDEWTAMFENIDACVTPVLSPREAANHFYNTERTVFEIGTDIQPRPAPRFSKTPGDIKDCGRTAGSGTRGGLLAWGISQNEQDELSRVGAFGSRSPS